MKRLTAPIAALIYTAAIAFANPGATQTLDEGQRAELEALRSGEMRKLVIHSEPIPAPDTVYTDPGETEYRLSDSNGAIRLVNFWATWCAPCRQEKPSLDALQAQLASDDFAVIAIATGRNSLEGIARFNEDVGITTLDTYLDPRSELAAGMNVPGLPVTVVLNRDGAEIARLMGGADWDSDSAKSIVAFLTTAPHE
jgi:thiol-disulfide isomerase/thioredoxin